MSSEPLTDRQEAILSATGITLSNDSEELPVQHPEAAFGELDEDYFTQPTNQQVEADLQSYDKTDAAEDN